MCGSSNVPEKVGDWTVSTMSLSSFANLAGTLDSASWKLIAMAEGLFDCLSEADQKAVTRFLKDSSNKLVGPMYERISKGMEWANSAKNTVIGGKALFHFGSQFLAEPNMSQEEVMQRGLDIMCAAFGAINAVFSFYGAYQKLKISNNEISRIFACTISSIVHELGILGDDIEDLLEVLAENETNQIEASIYVKVMKLVLPIILSAQSFLEYQKQLLNQLGNLQDSLTKEANDALWTNGIPSIM